VFLGLEWKSFKFVKGLLVVTACRERRSEEGGREYDRKVSTLRFAELEISFLISGFATSSSSSSCKPPCRKLKRVSGIRATSPGCDLERCSVTGLWGAACRGRRRRRRRKQTPPCSILAVLTGSNILPPLPYLRNPSHRNPF
jgi:hypothetical protein